MKKWKPMLGDAVELTRNYINLARKHYAKGLWGWVKDININSQGTHLTVDLGRGTIVHRVPRRYWKLVAPAPKTASFDVKPIVRSELRLERAQDRLNRAAVAWERAATASEWDERAMDLVDFRLQRAIRAFKKASKP